MIPDDVVEEVRARADLVQVVGEVVELKKSGKDWKGKCPFHDDRTPSFYVVPHKGFYTCFGCGESGDVFAFVMKRTGMDFNDAVKHLGQRFGVEVREVGRGDEADDPLRPLYEANAFARDWFRERLLDPEGGARARAYLDQRGIDADTGERFGLGYAPDGWRELRDHAAGHGFSEDLLLEVGLLTTSERAKEPYDRFRDRVVFPIESVTGKVVAFGGRVLGPSGKGIPKYLNSPESPVYHKGEILYALGWNRNTIRREEVALVVEGYMDVVSLAAGGIGNAVATLGTALTWEHARLLRRYTGRALLLFDSDEAGLRATFRAGDALLAAGIHPSVVTLPEGEDPDTLIQRQGPAALRRHLASAVDVLDRKIQLLDEHGYFGSIDRTRRAVDKLLPTVRAAADPALRDLYVAKVAERTGVRRETLEEEVRRGTAPGSTPIPSQGAAAGAPAGGRGARPSRDGGRSSRRARVFGGLGPERQLLLVLLRSREWIERAAEQIGEDDFHDAGYREIFRRLLEDPELAPDDPRLEERARRLLEDLLGDPEVLDHAGRILEESMAVLRDRRQQRRQTELEEALRAAPDSGRKRELLEEMERLRRERRGRWNVIRRGPLAGSRGPPESNKDQRKDR
jgi:DNA primase